MPPARGIVDAAEAAPPVMERVSAWRQAAAVRSDDGEMNVAPKRLGEKPLYLGLLFLRRLRRGFQFREVELHHLHHRGHHALAPAGVLGLPDLEQLFRRDLP